MTSDSTDERDLYLARYASRLSTLARRIRVLNLYAVAVTATNLFLLAIVPYMGLALRPEIVSLAVMAVTMSVLYYRDTQVRAATLLYDELNDFLHAPDIAYAEAEDDWSIRRGQAESRLAIRQYLAYRYLPFTSRYDSGLYAGLNVGVFLLSVIRNG